MVLFGLLSASLLQTIIFTWPAIGDSLTHARVGLNWRYRHWTLSKLKSKTSAQILKNKLLFKNWFLWVWKNIELNATTNKSLHVNFINIFWRYMQTRMHSSRMHTVSGVGVGVCLGHLRWGWGCLPRPSPVGRGVSAWGVCLPRGVYTPRGHNSWHTLVKTLPFRNYCCGR